MRKLLSVMGAAMTLAYLGPVVAASSVDVTVKGSITPAACTPMLTNGGAVDYGKISIKDLNPAAHLPTVLPVVSLRLNVECSAQTLMAVKVRDNRPGSSPESDMFNQNFGLGWVNGDKKIGWYILKMSNGTADGVDRSLIESVDGSTWFDAASADQVWQPGWMRALTGGGASPLPLPAQTMAVDIHVGTTILSRMQLPSDQEIPLDGSATLDMVYL